jgi:hypothetical protein
MAACLWACASAVAAEGSLEFGKCTAQAGGRYINGACTKPSKAGKEKFEWTPLSTAVGFTTAKARGSEAATIQTANGSEISCASEASKDGEYGPGRYELKNVVLEFSGCESAGLRCKSTGAKEGEIDTNRLHGEPGVVVKAAKEEKNLDATDLTAQAGSVFVELICGPVPPMSLDGGVVVEAASGGKLLTNKMLDKRVFEFVTEKSGHQVPERWTPEGTGVSHNKHEEVTEHLEGSSGGSGTLSLVTVQSNIGKTKLELRQCETNGC